MEHTRGGGEALPGYERTPGGCAHCQPVREPKLLNRTPVSDSQRRVSADEVAVFQGLGAEGPVRLVRFEGFGVCFGAPPPLVQRRVPDAVVPGT